MKKRSRMLSGAGLAKRALVMLLAFSMLVTGVVTAAPGDSGMKVYAESVVAVPTADRPQYTDTYTSGSLEYAIVSGSAVIAGCDASAAGVIEIPSVIDGYSVTAIGDYAFAGCKDITSVILPETVISLGNCAFSGCTGIESVTIPDSVTAVGIDAFSGCADITIANLTDGGLVTAIGTTDFTKPENVVGYSDEYGVLVSEDGGADVYAASSADWYVAYPDDILTTLKNGLISFSGDINIQSYGITVPELPDLVDALERKYPIEYASAGVSYYSYSYYPSNQLVASVKFVYTSSTISTEYSARYSALKSKVDQIMAAIEGMTDYEKLLYVHDYLILNGEYDLNYERYAAYDILVDGIGVCQAYTLAYQLIMDLCGIPCVRATSDEMNHTWNVVRIDGKWYQIDVTWDDPVPDVDGRIYYTHFVLNDSEMEAEDHYAWESPYECTSTTYSGTPRGTNSTQYYYNGRWYLYDSSSNSVVSCDIYGNDTKTVCSPATGGMSVYNGILYYGNGSSIMSYGLNSGEKKTIYTLSAAEKANSEGSLAVNINTIMIDDSGKLSYTYKVWKLKEVNGNTSTYTSSILQGSKTIDVSAYSDAVLATAIKLDKSTASLTVGGTVTLTATVTPANSTDKVTWKTSDASIATVSGGKVTAAAPGTATITATAGAYSAKCVVTVTAPATAIKLDKSTASLTVGGTVTLTATVTPANSTDKVTWKTSDENIATVSGGKVTAAAPGTATITATAGAYSAKCVVTVEAADVDYDVTPNINGGASKLYEPWGLRYFAVYNGADMDKITDRGIAILKDKYYTDGMTAEAFCKHQNVHVYLDSKGELGFEDPSTNNPNGRYYATLTEGIYSYDISAYYYVVPFAVMENGETIYGTIKKNSMEKILNTNLGLSSITATEKAICTCILELKESVAEHYAATGVPGASIDMDIPRGDTQTAAKSVTTTAQSGITPNIVAGASRLIEPWGLRYFATYTASDSIADRGVVILCEKYYDSSYSTNQDKMRLNANAYVFTESNGTLLYDDDSARYYATVTEGISSKDIADVYYVVPYVVLDNGSYVYGTVKSNSMLKIMNINLNIASVAETEKQVSRDIIALYEAVKEYYASK